MKKSLEIIFDKLVYSCAFEQYRGDEEFIPDHFLGFQISGETHTFHDQSTTVVKKNTVIFVRKNQLIRTIKYPSSSEKYQFISITLDREILQKYALENNISPDVPFTDTQKFFLKPDDFFHSYFLSLKPYIDKTKEATPRLADLKIREAIELLLQSNPDFKNVLFDFSEPHKINLNEFMNQNFMFNVPLESFAKLTGRSLSGFKRDFKKSFQTTPKQWLREKRLEEAYYLIKHNNKKPVDIYLDLGFENLSHFYYSFKQKFGVTTTEI